MIRRLVSLAFSDSGDTVVSCASGLEALGHLVSNPNYFDVVLIDRQMPVLDGIETARRIRKEIAKFPKLIIMSADISLEDVIECNSVADGTMEKPIRMEDFNKLWSKMSRPSG
jgi:CheY-like chemotaxis protein